MKFRKKPVEIEAIKWNGYSNNIGFTNGKLGDECRYDLPEWMPPVSYVVPNGHYPVGVPAGAIWRHREDLYIGTLEGAMCCSVGDWVIRGVQGELYPCKPDIFKVTYEEV
jgi:hypothetical protein